MELSRGQLENFSSPAAPTGWVLTSNDVIENEREDDTAIGRTLVMYPIQAKGKKPPSTSFLDLANDASRAKWAKLALATPAE